MSEVRRVIGNSSHVKHQHVLDLMLPAFEDAVEFSKRGDWTKEVECLNAAFEGAKSMATLKGPGWFADARDLLIENGLIFRNSKLIGVVTPESGLEAIGRKQSLLAGASLGTYPITVRSDRVIFGLQVGKIDEFTSAHVFVDGVDQITQRPTLTRMALLAPLPGLALIPGLALQKKTRNDLRDITFSIQSADWQFAIKVAPGNIQHAKAIAERVNALASRSQAKTNQSNVPQSSTVLELEKLHDLFTKGALTADEFINLKSKLLDN